MGLTQNLPLSCPGLGHLVADHLGLSQGWASCAVVIDDLPNGNDKASLRLDHDRYSVFMATTSSIVTIILIIILVITNNSVHTNMLLQFKQWSKINTDPSGINVQDLNNNAHINDLQSVLGKCAPGDADLTGENSSLCNELQLPYPPDRLGTDSRHGALLGAGEDVRQILPGVSCQKSPGHRPCQGEMDGSSITSDEPSSSSLRVLGTNPQGAMTRAHSCLETQEGNEDMLMKSRGKGRNAIDFYKVIAVALCRLPLARLVFEKTIQPTVPEACELKHPQGKLIMVAVLMQLWLTQSRVSGASGTAASRRTDPISSAPSVVRSWRLGAAHSCTRRLHIRTTLSGEADVGFLEDGGNVFLSARLSAHILMWRSQAGIREMGSKELPQHGTLLKMGKMAGWGRVETRVRVRVARLGCTFPLLMMQKVTQTNKANILTILVPRCCGPETRQLEPIQRFAEPSTDRHQEGWTSHRLLIPVLKATLDTFPYSNSAVFFIHIHTLPKGDRIRTFSLGAGAEDELHIVEGEAMVYHGCPIKVTLATLKMSVQPAVSLGGLK
ncbi:hypothetical protein GH733_006932 [Mirounga leonina]|nr:hypothetical protein GH733_006932 [Mirounga leonina]